MLIHVYIFIPIVLLLASSILFAVWIYKDAEANGENGLLWLLVALVLPNLLGVILYLLLVKREKQFRCTNCHHLNKGQADYCELCGTQLDKSLFSKPKTNGLWKYALACLVLAIICVFGLFILNLIYVQSLT